VQHLIPRKLKGLGEDTQGQRQPDDFHHKGAWFKHG
jgi:hypothetical protein